MGMQVQPNVQDLLDKMVEQIVRVFHPDKIILFGSHARGWATSDSDVDLLVVMPVEGSPRHKATEIDIALADRRLSLDLIVVTPEQFERQQHMAGTIVQPAAREGKVLCERAA